MSVVNAIAATCSSYKSACHKQHCSGTLRVLLFSSSAVSACLVNDTLRHVQQSSKQPPFSK
jgi:hypothetical protein